MLTPFCQRWRDRRGSYRLAGEPIATRRYEVALIERDNDCKPFVLQHHYSGSYPLARLRVGLYRSDELVGVAVLSHPTSQRSLEVALPVPGATKRAELGRFVLLDDVPANGESWFLTRAFELARAEGFDAVYAQSDPEPRQDAQGVRTCPGHVGTIYQATNAVYTGKTLTATRRVHVDGRVLDNRAIGKCRLRHTGWRYALDQLVAYGAPMPDDKWLDDAREPDDEWRAWLKHAVETTTRTVRHRGNHRYLWALDKRLRRHLPSGVTYPKFHMEAR